MLPRFQIPDVEIVVWPISALCNVRATVLLKERALSNLYGHYKFAQKTQGQKKHTFIEAEMPIPSFLRSRCVHVSTCNP